MVHFKEVSAFSSVFSSFFFGFQNGGTTSQKCLLLACPRLTCTFSTDECMFECMIYTWLNEDSCGSPFLERGLHWPWHGLCCEVIAGDSKRAENSNVMGPTPRTHSGAKSYEVGCLGSPSQVCAMLQEHPPGESC